MADGEVLTGRPADRKRPSRLFGQYIIKHRFQFKFSFMIFIFLGVAAFIIWMEGYLAVKHMVSSGIVAQEDAVAQLQLLNGIVAKTSMLALAIAFGLSLFFSHFVAGPLYRFERTLEEMTKGNLTLQVHLRKFDEFKEVAELFNQALMGLRFKVKKEREIVDVTMDKIQHVSDKLKQAGRVQEAHELDQLLVDIRNTPPQIQV